MNYLSEIAAWNLISIGEDKSVLIFYGNELVFVQMNITLRRIIKLLLCYYAIRKVALCMRENEE